ncbi:Hypothetical predicted protein [Podarcis lilfordi]|uniref:Uncharacterized protein n=1 Tax=Podarcis lilfordi TaxID=74358 RepID=A0AA35KER6_9SAUR|nr:Hypothetical predicted protein [Podarcis lilfordi]
MNANRGPLRTGQFCKRKANTLSFLHHQETGLTNLTTDSGRSKPQKAAFKKIRKKENELAAVPDSRRSLLSSLSQRRRRIPKAKQSFPGAPQGQQCRPPPPEQEPPRRLAGTPLLPTPDLRPPSVPPLADSRARRPQSQRSAGAAHFSRGRGRYNKGERKKAGRRGEEIRLHPAGHVRGRRTRVEASRGHTLRVKRTQPPSGAEEASRAPGPELHRQRTPPLLAANASRAREAEAPRLPRKGLLRRRNTASCGPQGPGSTFAPRRAGWLAGRQAAAAAATPTQSASWWCCGGSRCGPRPALLSPAGFAYGLRLARCRPGWPLPRPAVLAAQRPLLFLSLLARSRSPLPFPARRRILLPRRAAAAEQEKAPRPARQATRGCPLRPGGIRAADAAALGPARRPSTPANVLGTRRRSGTMGERNASEHGQTPGEGGGRGLSFVNRRAWLSYVKAFPGS